ncbi:MAG TPA: glycosyl transferase family 2 [Flavobacteriales bacterium]|nr:glycosyl transferase family 2 [Flavobacteriales bacterium]
MIGIDQISIHFGSRVLLKEASIQISRGDKIGLIGKNGAGKSTLIKILAGISKPDSGKISLSKELKIGYLPQEMPLPEGKTVFDEASEAFSDLLRLNAIQEDITEQLSERTDHESNEYMDLIHQQSEISEQLNLGGWYDITMKVEKVLLGLGFEARDFKRSTGEFSGGWRMRIELAKILLSEPHLLLLDEPTNHLDIESIGWLESFLHTLPFTVVLISHDIAFLNKITNRTIEIADSQLYDFPLPYSRYMERRSEMRETLLAAQKNQQKKIKDTEDFVNRFRAKNTKAKQVQSRIKMLDRMEVIEIDEEKTSSMKIRFPEAPRSGKINLELKHISKSYGDAHILNDINLILGRGEKVAFVGKNGAGKTTLSKIIVGDISSEGEVKLGHQIALGYYAQDQSDTLNPKLDVFTTVENESANSTVLNLRSLLGAFLFSGDDQYKKVSVLSGGEKARLALCKLLLKPVNFLVLDEPTNHLDIQSKSILKSALQSYKGSMIVVSHDREFLTGLTEKVFEFSEKGIKAYNGDITEYLKSSKLKTLDDLHQKTKPSAPKKEVKASSNKQEYEERKALAREKNRLSSRINKLETEIMEFESQLSDINEKITASPSYQSDLINQYQEVQKKLELSMRNWEKDSLALEKLD